MADVSAVEILLWGKRIGAVSWDGINNLGEFQYDPDFIQSGLEVSPIVMPLSKKVYRFPELRMSDTFLALPGLIADSLTEKFGNALMVNWLAKQGLNFNQLTPVERLCYIGKRGMGALEYQPDFDPQANQKIDLNVSELVQIAQEVMNQHNNSKVEVSDESQVHKLIQVGTSAGGAKAKAIIAFNENSGEIMSGQGDCLPGFDHWILKFSEVENSEHEADRDVGRLEYAYHNMAVEAGITMMECRLLHDKNREHFMTRRFDRIDGMKIHVHTFCGMTHEDRNPVGNTHYETLFTTARKLNLGQEQLNELYRRMVFNIIARNQDDHSKNHAFMMDGSGTWRLTPAYDIVFTYKKNSRFVDKQQMRCNGKRDNFTQDDLNMAAIAADIKNPDKIIQDVKDAIKLWPDFANEAGLKSDQAKAIKGLFRDI